MLTGRTGGRLSGRRAVPGGRGQLRAAAAAAGSGLQGWPRQRGAALRATAAWGVNDERRAGVAGASTPRAQPSCAVIVEVGCFSIQHDYKPLHDTAALRPSMVWSLPAVRLARQRQMHRLCRSPTAQLWQFPTVQYMLPEVRCLHSSGVIIETLILSIAAQPLSSCLV
jgi:hypothetical protein